VGEADGRPYYAMTLLAGRSLSALARSGTLPEPRELARRIAMVADALHAIHRAGVVHRDVKPGNIMADADGRMVLADFGLARSSGSATLTKTGEALGTPLFMSPEQLVGERGRIDGRSDVYGLGATLYELLAGRPLFDATDWPGLVRAILEKRPTPPHEIAPAVPVELSRIVMKAVEKQPGDRYESAAAMRDDLLAFAEGRAVAGRPVSAARRRLRLLRRRWRPLVVAAAVLFVAAYLFLTWKATLSVKTYPPAAAFLDGKPMGMTPLEVRVRPGRHSLVLKSDGFEDYVWEDRLVWGSTAIIDRMLIADPDDPAARAILARRFGLATVRLHESERSRGAPADRIEPLFPRGAVRPEDLTDLRIDVGEEWNAQGRRQVRAGCEVLFSEEFKPEMLDHVEPFPEAVRARLKPGDTFEWGFYPETGAPRVATCTLVETPPAIGQIEQDLKDQAPSVRARLLAQAFLREHLFLAAYRLASGLAEGGQDDEEALAVMQAALEGMGLQQSPPWDDLLRRIDRTGR